MKVLMVIAALGLLTGSVQAEMRIWADKKGNTIEAEFINIMGNKVVLKTPDGKIHKVPKAGLCANDQKYLAANIPPTLKISVDVDKDRDTISSYSSTYGTYGSETKQEVITCAVEIKKTNREACSKKFKAYIYVFSESLASKQYRVLDISETEMSFVKTKSASFNSDPVTIQFSDNSYSGKSGYKYSGYLVVVEDESGRIIMTEASKNGFASNAGLIRKVKEGARLTGKFVEIK